MSFWRVRVDCYSKASHTAKPKRTVRWFIVEGDMSTHKEVALDYAEKTASFGPLWVDFQFSESASLKFPLEINQP